MLSGSKHSDVTKAATELEFAFVPPSSLPRIPQSTSRPSREGITSRNPLFSSLQATPTRRATSNVSRSRGGLLSAVEVDYGSCLPSSPLHVRRSSAQLFTAVPNSAIKMQSSFGGIQETPVKTKQPATLDHSHPVVPGPGSDKENEVIEGAVRTSAGLKEGTSTAGETSIYKSLGWDDADDLDDLV